MKVTEVLDEFGKYMDEVEAKLPSVLADIETNTAKAKQVKTAKRRTDQLRELLDELDPGTEHLAGTVELVGKLESKYPVPSVDGFKTEVVTMSLTALSKAVEAADLVPGVPVEDCKAAIARWEGIEAKLADAFKATPAPASSDGTRNVGAHINVTCACGDFERNSAQGDWTSIRYQAKEHAKTCATANPGLGDQLTNDLDRVRDSLINRRENTVSGGLRFTIEGGKDATPHTAAA
jgi:hypothetical protein